MYYVGIDLGGTNIAAGIVSEENKILKKSSIPTGADRPSDAITRDMADLVTSLAKEAGISPSEIASVGIAAPGIVLSETGVIVYSCNLPFVQYPLAEKFSAFSGISGVYVENDANAAALGEAVAGGAAGTRDSLMITLGTGVGGGIIIGGKIRSGFNFAGGELGHMVIEKDGVLCSCGRRGCWETYSSATGLIRMTKEKIAACRATRIPSLLVKRADAGVPVDGRMPFDAMEAGDESAAEVVKTYVSYLACGLTNMINIFQPEVLLLGGGVSAQGERLLNLLRPEIEHQQYSRDLPKERQTRIGIATLGNDAGIIGGANLWRKTE